MYSRQQGSAATPHPRESARPPNAPGFVRSPVPALTRGLPSFPAYYPSYQVTSRVPTRACLPPPARSALRGSRAQFKPPQPLAAGAGMAPHAAVGTSRPPHRHPPPGAAPRRQRPSAQLGPARQRQPLPAHHPPRVPRAGRHTAGAPLPAARRPRTYRRRGGRGRQGAAPRAPPAGPPPPARRKLRPPLSVTSAGRGRGLRAAPLPRAAGGGDGGTAGAEKRERDGGLPLGALASR